MKCHLRSGSVLKTNHENSSFYRTLYKSISVQSLGMLLYSRDFQELLCTVTCIKNLLLPNLYDKPQCQMTLNHIESKCYHPYNHLPDNGRPFVASVSILPIPVSSLNMQGLFVAELLLNYSRA